MYCPVQTAVCYSGDRLARLLVDGCVALRQVTVYQDGVLLSTVSGQDIRQPGMTRLDQLDCLRHAQVTTHGRFLCPRKEEVVVAYNGLSSVMLTDQV